MSVRNFLAIAALQEASTLAVLLPLAVDGVLSLIYVPTEANIPIPGSRSHFEIILKGGHPYPAAFVQVPVPASISALSMR